jgi:predicted HNH restriction endonuclease
MRHLFHASIYVNANPDRLRGASHGPDPSEPLLENKPWTTGSRLYEEAKAAGEELPFVFAHLEPLVGWALARDVKLEGRTTSYRFAYYREFAEGRGYQRNDLTVLKTQQPLPNDFIRSYAIVQTPRFLQRLWRQFDQAARLPDSDAAGPRTQPDTGLLSEELVGIEGAVLQRLVSHRRREQKLRTAKIRQVLVRSGGVLRCEVPGCGFDFRVAYGTLGDGYAQVHHRRPLSTSDENQITTLDDLAVVCANCHAMIHRNGECRPLEQLIER